MSCDMLVKKKHMKMWKTYDKNKNIIYAIWVDI